MHKLHFCTGMPRSGSTLLMNILLQNAEVHGTATSPLVEAVLAIKQNWERWPEALAMEAEARYAAKARVIRGMLEGFYSDCNALTVIDKNRAWLGEAELLAAVMGTKPKFLVCVRPMLDILASFEKLWRENKGKIRVPQEASNPAGWATVEGRCQVLLGINEVVGASYNRVKDAFARGWQKEMLIVEFDRLTTYPAAVLAEIYDFLELPKFEHDFEHVKQITHEDDSAYGWLGLHDIREKVLPVKSHWKETLAPYITPENLKAYKEQSVFWKET